MLIKRTILPIIAISMAVLNTACSEVLFSQEGGSAVPQLTVEQTDQNETGTDLNSAITPVKVTYPSYAKIVRGMMADQNEIYVKANLEAGTCSVESKWSVIEETLCMPDDHDFSIFCPIITPIATVDKNQDYTCEREFVAAEILAVRGGVKCEPQSETLSGTEIAELNNPEFYGVNSSVDPTTLDPSNLPATTLPMMNTIVLDESCGCYYSSTNLSYFTYRMPAHQSHCSAHFEDVY